MFVNKNERDNMDKKFMSKVADKLSKIKEAQEEWEDLTPIQQAYFDTYKRVQKYGYQVIDKLRDLHWRGDTWLSIDAAVQAFKSIEPGFAYNEFEPELLSKLKKFESEILIQPARESSVCIYVKGVYNGDILGRLQEELKADEVDFEGEELRIWWD
jgi:hypothetical protein